ncbi:hypothetical protein FGRMN_6990 [Fusarium graminum]|nr:hypothetical protein FGRMN_6990 [Fusarium graminum]
MVLGLDNIWLLPDLSRGGGRPFSDCGESAAPFRLLKDMQPRFIRLHQRPNLRDNWETCLYFTLMIIVSFQWTRDHHDNRQMMWTVTVSALWTIIDTITNAAATVLTFSELDFARLGLTSKDINDGFPAGDGFLLQHLEFPSQAEEFTSNQDLFTDDLLDLDITAVPQNDLWLDPTLDLESWQAPVPIQTDNSRDVPISPLASIEDRTRTPIITNPWSIPGVSQNFAGSLKETQQHSLPRKRSQYFRHQPQRVASDPISIPRSNIRRDGALDPMQRWQESPPEAEAASLSAICDALKKAPLRTRSSAGSLGNRRVGSRAGSRAGSNASFGSVTSYSSASVGSHSPQSGTRWTSSRGRVAKTKRGPTKKGKGVEKRRFQCTFCCDSFKSKYDWARHEKSLHLDLQGWRCTPFGGAVVSSDTGRSHCAYCNQLDPTTKHLETHNHAGCQDNEKPHIFRRKDHLVQHLRLVHHIQTLPIIDSWKVEGPPIKSRCGICSIRMETWQERVEHLAKHFRKGDTMADWKGEHDFEQHVKARVTNSLAPYMIAAEEKAPVPFSATDPSSRDHLLQVRQNAGLAEAGVPGSGILDTAAEETAPVLERSMTQDDGSLAFPEFLVHHLGRYGQQQMSLGVMPTDDMFQTEARRIVYNSLDPWDQTLADNKDWLSCFRNHHMGGFSS